MTAMTSNFPHPDELIQGFQQHQAKKFQTGRPAAQPGFHQGGHYEPARIGAQYYMDLAGNIIREVCYIFGFLQLLGTMGIYKNLSLDFDAPM